MSLRLRPLILSITLPGLISMANAEQRAEIESTDRHVLVRPHVGYGTLDGENLAHYGGRILLSAGGVQRYGFELTRFEGSQTDFTVAGIVLEQRLKQWFNMSIGSVGYFDYGRNNENLVGLVTNLGWEPDYQGPLKPFITYRADFIFDQQTEISHSISAGLSFTF